jgi:signal peptidase II
LKKSYLVIGLVLLILILDQALKIWIKTTFCYGEERSIMGLSWAKLNFVENPGMAFGWKLGGEYGKLALSVFRLIAIGFIIYYISKLIKKGVNTGLLLSFSLILAGAIGNILDSAFYGLIFSNSDDGCVHGPAKLFPPQGYAGFLHGKVVDMLYFPLWRNELGQAVFFQPVFNIADSAITMGVLSILLFQRNYFSSDDKKVEETTVSEAESITETTENALHTEGVDDETTTEVKNENIEEKPKEDI